MTGAAGHSWSAEAFDESLDRLRWAPRSWDAPSPGSVLVEVLAAGVGLPDSLMLQGVYPLVRRPPVTPGQEVCGRVVAVAEDSRFAVGDRVFGTTLFYAGSGSFATHAYVNERNAAVVPESMSNEDAAGFMIGFRTAHTTLVVRAGLQPGERVLVLGGAGGTGATAVQLAKALGASVTAVASTPEKQQFCTDLGADSVVGRDADAIRAAGADQGFDVIVDPVGGALASAAMSVIARYGRFAVVGFASGSWADVDVLDMVGRNYSVLGVLAAGFTPEEDRAHTAELVALAEAGKLATPIAAVLGIDEAPAAIAALREGTRPGKFVLSAG